MTNRAYLIFDDILRDKTLSSAQCPVPLQYLHRRILKNSA